MRDINLRYMFRRKADGHLYTIIVSVDSLEGRGDNPITTMFKNELWACVARDLFTGLQDSKGADIYEGDILSHIPEKMKGKVWKESGGFKSDCDGWGNSWLGDYNLDDLEVIGNITESPELLEAQD